MVAMTGSRPTVLVVDDEQNVVDAHALWLDDECDVRTATGGEEALEAVDDVDVVLLDRRMPDISGDEVLTEIRERDIECRVAMVTAVAPDFDVLEMPFDAYLTKPVEQAELLETAEALLTLDELDDLQYELRSKRVRKNVLEVEKEPWELAESEEYRRLEEEVEDLAEEAEELGREIDDILQGLR